MNLCVNCIFDLQVLHPQSMRPAREGDIPVRVKNSYNPTAPGTLITKTRDMSKVCRIVSWHIDDKYDYMKYNFNQC